MEPASPPPARRRWWLDVIGVVISVGLVLVVYHQVAFGGKTFDTSSEVAGLNGALPSTGVPRPTFQDLYRPDRAAGALQTVPWAQVTHREIDDGDVPWWNPYQGAGQPLAANVQSAAFDPLMLAVDLHPTTRTWDLTFLFYFMLGSAAMYLFLRTLDLSVPGCIAGAGAFTMSGFFAMDTSDSFVRVATYIPILFLAVALVIRAPKLRWVAFLGVATAGCILAGMPEISIFAAIGAATYATYRILTMQKAKRAKAAIATGAGGLVGVLLAAPLLLAAAQYLALSSNVHSTGVGLRTVPTASLLTYLIPYFAGPPSSRVAAAAMDRGWVGVAVVVLIAAAASAGPLMRRCGGWFFVVLAGVFLFRDHNVWGFRWISHLPLINRLDALAFSPLVPTFCLAVLAAIGIHAIGAGQVRWRPLAIGLAVIGVAVTALLWANRSLLAPLHGAFHPHNYLIAVIAGVAAVSGSVLGAVGSRSPKVRRWAALLAAIAVLGELFALFPQDIYAPRSNPYHSPPWLTLVSKGLSGSPAARVFGLDGVAFPDTPGVLGLQDPQTVDALYVARYRTFIDDFVTREFTDRFDSASASDITGNPMFNLLGVPVVLAQSTDLTQSGAGQFDMLGTAGGIQVFANRDALPRAFVVASVHRAPSTAAAVSYLQHLGTAQPDGTTRVQAFDPALQAVVEAPAADARGSEAPINAETSRAPAGTPAGARLTRITSYAATRVVVQVGAGAGDLLVLTDSYFPGWQATVNGRPAPILATDVAFRGVILSQAASTVVFTYHPPGQPLTWLLPLLAVVAMCAAGFAATRLHPRHSLGKG